MFKVSMNELAVSFVLALLVLLIPASSQAGYQTTAFAFTNYKSWSCSGSYGTLLTTDPYVSMYSGDANFMAIEFDTRNFLELGWCEGATYWGNTNGVRQLYYAQKINDVYSGGLLGEIQVDTWHSYRLMYQLGTTWRWTAYFDGIAKATAVFAYRTGLPSANVEIHDTRDDINVHITNLQYALTAGRIIRWYPWDGYGATRADWPLYMTIISNTEWTAVS